jgi:hypothetical protein
LIAAMRAITSLAISVISWAVSVISLHMIASPHARKHQCTSQCNTPLIIIALSRRIVVREGVSDVFSSDFIRPIAAHRAWISSSISISTKVCFSDCRSLTFVTFESNSTLHS